MPQAMEGETQLRRSARPRRASALAVAGIVAAGGALGVALHVAFASVALALLGPIASGVALGLATHGRMARWQRVIDELTRACDALNEGRELPRLRNDDLGELSGLATALSGVFDSLGNRANRVLSIVQQVQDLPTRLTSKTAAIEEGAEAQEEAVEESASLLANLNSSIHNIDERVERLSHSAEDSSSSILQMGSTLDEVARNVGTLNESVESSASSVHEMGASIRQVAKSAESLNRIAEETATSMFQMDRSLQEVGEHAQHASQLSAEVSDGAEEGSKAVAATIDDIEQIRHLTTDAKQGLEQLVARIREVASILGVIREINDETNLLSLNAAIIAAQAGEQGKAFLVVANHVKTLAHRTAASTKDIAELIGAVQTESDTAVRAMGAGFGAIEQGVERSRRAGQLLDTIRDSAHESSSRVADIARATEEQARNSKLVSSAAQETSAQVQQISMAMAEQTRASEQMHQASESALQMCRHVHQSTEEQRETGRYITSAISNITEMIRDIHEQTATHKSASESMSAAVMHLLDNARKTGRHVPEVREMLEQVRAGAESVIAELAPFKPADH